MNYLTNKYVIGSVTLGTAVIGSVLILKNHRHRSKLMYWLNSPVHSRFRLKNGYATMLTISLIS